jgi:hypothetical protein
MDSTALLTSKQWLIRILDVQTQLDMERTLVRHFTFQDGSRKVE